MPVSRHVRLFRNGRSQAVRIPRDFELPGKEALIRQEDGKLILEPVSRPSLLTVLAALEPIAEEFPRIEDLPAEQIDL